MIVFNWSFSAWNHFTAVVFVGQFAQSAFLNRTKDWAAKQPKRLATYKKSSQ